MIEQIAEVVSGDILKIGVHENRQIIGAYCPNLLFPFAREAVTDLVGKGGFPGLLLQPINFDALYLQQMQEMAQASGESETVADKH